MNDDLQPLINDADVQRGWKDMTLQLKSGTERSVRVNAPAWDDVAALHLEAGNNQVKVEQGLIALALPAHLGGTHEDAGRAHAWLDWLDMESRNDLMRTVREFAYGFGSEKKRTLALRQLSKLFLQASKTPPSNAPGSASPTPSAGAAPSSPVSPNASAASKPTTA